MRGGGRGTDDATFEEALTILRPPDGNDKGGILFSKTGFQARGA